LRRRLSASLREVGAPLPLAALALLAVNDHLLKPLLHDALTGKLSDVAICFLLPLLVSAALGVAVGWSARRRLWIGAAIATAVFASLELSDAAVGLYRQVFGRVATRDATDLLTLLVVPLAVVYGRWRSRRAPGARPRWAAAAGALALAGGAVALAASGPPEKCGHYTAPVVFQVHGDCGPDGLIVVQANQSEGTLRIANPGALGLPPLDSGQNAAGSYLGTSCPYTLAQGEWQVTVGGCVTPTASASADAGDADAGDADAGGTDAGGIDAGCVPQYRTCQAALVSGVLQFTCDDPDGGAPLCSAQLTVVP
jgi:hypothetical protein